MARRKKQNRKKQQQSGFVFPLPLAALLMLAAVLALSYLWLCGRCEALGKRIKQLETVRTEVQRQRYNEEYKWANLKSPPSMMRALRRHNLEMYWPTKRQVVEIHLSQCEQLAHQHGAGQVWDPHEMRVAMNE
jgi:hypothetical protein